MFVRTKAINKMLSCKARKKVVQGSTWAGKTFGIMSIAGNNAAIYPRELHTVVCETFPAVKQGPYKQFLDIMIDTGRFVPARLNKTDLSYTFANGSVIQFKSFDSVGKAQAAGKRDRLYLNEVQYIPYEIADALIMRTTKDVYLDFNPNNEFWAHTEIATQKDAELLTLTYKDNEAVPETILQELQSKAEKAFYNPYGDWHEKTNIKNEYWANWCRVYIRGEIGNLQGAIFTNWQILDNLPLEAELKATGLDFGYSNDPAAAVDYYEYNGLKIFDEVLYQKGLLNNQLADRLKLGTLYPRQIIADSAEPKSIAELQAYGLFVLGAEKGPESIQYGIQLMQQAPFYVTARSLNFIKELRGYVWLKDAVGNSLNTPIGANNHLIDAARYIALNRFAPQNQGSMSSRVIGNRNRREGH